MKRTLSTFGIALTLICITFLTAITPSQAIIQKPDLVNQSFSITYSANGGYNLRVGIHNYGPGTAGACTLRMTLYTPVLVLGRPGAVGRIINKSVPSVPAYGTVYVNFDLGPDDPEDKWADFLIDSASVVSETNENNNSVTVYLW